MLSSKIEYRMYNVNTILKINSTNKRLVRFSILSNKRNVVLANIQAIEQINDLILKLKLFTTFHCEV